MRPKKSLGQHFLIHARIAERIVHVADIHNTDTVLEVGPGTGILTDALLSAAKRVIAIETDAALLPRLTERFATAIQKKKLILVHADIRSFDLTTLPREYCVVANIPYYITGEIFRLFLSAKHQPRSMTLLVQKEVAERIARAKKESLLSLSIKVYGEPRYEFTVPKGAFTPAPKVDSAVLSIKNISRQGFKKGGETRFFSLIHAGFAHKRKRLAKNLAEIGFASSTLQPNVRAEDLTVSEWLALAHAPSI